MGFTRIIIVEDDPEIRGVVIQILVGAGYPIAEFDDPEGAMTYAEKSTVPVVFFFGGLRQFAEVRARREAGLANVRVLLATGAGGLCVPRFKGVDVLRKPFTVETLLAAVARAA